MRTTIVIEDDILDKAKAMATKLHAPFRQVVNDALRTGLQMIEKPPRIRTYRTHPHKMGLKDGMNLDNIQELLSQIEGEQGR